MRKRVHSASEIVLLPKLVKAQSTKKRIRWPDLIHHWDGLKRLEGSTRGGSYLQAKLPFDWKLMQNNECQPQHMLIFDSKGCIRADVYAKGHRPGDPPFMELRSRYQIELDCASGHGGSIHYYYIITDKGMNPEEEVLGYSYEIEVPQSYSNYLLYPPFAAWSDREHTRASAWLDERISWWQDPLAWDRKRPI